MRKQFVLFPNEDGWRLAIVGETVEFETVPSAEKVADILSRLERSPRVWVALPSHECLCATIATTGLPRKSGDALKFRLEEIFPWAAEDFIAIDLPSGSDQAFVVVTRRAELDARVGALREAGIVVAGVSPAALLAASRVCEPETDAVVFREGFAGSISLIRLQNRQPVAWNLLADDPEPLQDRLKDNPPRQLIVVGEIRAAASSVRGESMETLAAQEAAGVLRRERRAPINFLQSQRSRPAAMWAAVACAAILFGCCAGLLWRTANYNREADRADAAARATFARIFPGAPVPAGVVSRLLGEARSMQAASGTAADVPQQSGDITHTLATSLGALGSLPAATRFAVDDLTLDARHIAITGQAASLVDAQSVADALNAIHGWTTEPPRTEQRLAAVSFAVQALAPSASQSTAAAGGNLP